MYSTISVGVTGCVNPPGGEVSPSSVFEFLSSWWLSTYIWKTSFNKISRECVGETTVG